jgi:GNAT superfamily N-acetyltransferase
MGRGQRDRHRRTAQTPQWRRPAGFVSDLRVLRHRGLDGAEFSCWGGYICEPTNDAVAQLWLLAAPISSARRTEHWNHLKGTGSFLFISRLEIAEELRAKGLGRMIVETIERRAELEGYRVIGLRATTRSAQEYWLHLGYEPTGKTDDRFMKRIG